MRKCEARVKLYVAPFESIRAPDVVPAKRGIGSVESTPDINDEPRQSGAPEALGEPLRGARCRNAVRVITHRLTVLVQPKNRANMTILSVNS